jgi:hypothetical protein
MQKKERRTLIGNSRLPSGSTSLPPLEPIARSVWIIGSCQMACVQPTSSRLRYSWRYHLLLLLETRRASTGHWSCVGAIMQCAKFDIAASHKGQSRTLFSQPRQVSGSRDENYWKICFNSTGARKQRQLYRRTYCLILQNIIQTAVRSLIPQKARFDASRLNPKFPLSL